jgi:pimeloyl-ACP methyl ester carboxylesterase
MISWQACEEPQKELRAITGFADVNGARLYYEQMGEGHPIIFIHGFSLDTRMWDDQFQKFAEHYNVIRYDARGFGKSDLPDTTFSPTDDLYDLINYLKIEKAHIIGLSMGGWYAFDFIPKYPEKVSALISVDGLASGFKQSKDFRRQLRTIFNRARKAGVKEAKDLWLDHPLFVPASRNPVVKEKLMEIVSDYSGIHWLDNSAGGEGPEVKAISVMSEITIPTLVIVGELDLPDFRAFADTCESLITGAQKVIIPDCGHMSNMEKPDEFNRIVLGFLKEVDKNL